MGHVGDDADSKLCYLRRSAVQNQNKTSESLTLSTISILHRILQYRT